MTEPPPDAAVVAPSRASAAVVGVVMLLLAASLGRYLLGRPDGSAAGWVVAVLFLAMFVAIGVASLRGALRRPDRIVLDVGGLTRVRRDAETRTPLAEVDRVEFHPAEATTWTGPDRPGEPRLLSRRRTEARLRVTGPGLDVSLLTSQSAWPDAVAVLQGWVRECPELAADDGTRAFFAGLAEPAGVVAPPRRWRIRPWLVTAAALWAGATAALVAVAVAYDLPVLTPSALVGYAFGGLLVTGAVAYAVATSLSVLRALVHLVRGDPWWLFRPSPDGRYSWVVSGRMSALRAPRGGTVLGLMARWALMLGLLVVSWLPLGLIVRLVLVLVLEG